MLAEVENLHHVGVLELGGDARLVEEHRDELFVAAEGVDDPLHHHQLLKAVHARLVRQPDLRHSPGGELGDQRVAAYLRAGSPTFDRTFARALAAVVGRLGGGRFRLHGD